MRHNNFMLLSSYSSAYTANQGANQASSNYYQFQTQGQAQYSPEELAAQAKASRVRHLNRLMEKLDALIHQSVEDLDPQQALTQQSDTVAYVLARLNGADEGDAPESLGELAYALDDLLDDILAAWDLVLNAGDLIQQPQDIEDLDAFDGVLLMLERIASRRIERVMNNVWYQQWRQLYREPQLASQSRLFELLKDATSLQDSSGLFLVRADLREKIEARLDPLRAA